MTQTEIINLLKIKYGLMAIPARILGKRWEFAGGNSDIPVSFPTRIRLNENEGIIVYSDQPVPEEVISMFKTVGRC